RPLGATVTFNGPFFAQGPPPISVFDHGFLYGEGIYETLRTYNGQPFLFDRHMTRLRKSAAMLALDVPLSDAAIDARFRDTMKAAGLGDSPEREAHMRVPSTRGIRRPHYAPG